MSYQDHEMELEPGPPDPDEACMVCNKMECECPPEDLEVPREHLKRMIEYGMENQRDLSRLVTFRSHWDDKP